jgi:hypothetical protein
MLVYKKYDSNRPDAGFDFALLNDRKLIVEALCTYLEYCVSNIEKEIP